MSGLERFISAYVFFTNIRSAMATTARSVPLPDGSFSFSFSLFIFMIPSHHPLPPPHVASCSVSTLEKMFVSQVACGSNHSMCVATTREEGMDSRLLQAHFCSDNHVWTWGEVGDGSGRIMRPPAPSPTHTNIHMAQGLSGQLGHNDNNSRWLPTRVETLDGLRVTRIDAGASHSLALTCLGHVYFWGSGACGQLGEWGE